MPRWTLDGALRVTIACIVLLSLSPATADAWMERMTGTIGAMQPVSRAVVIEAPRHGGGREVRGGQSLSLLFLSGVILGVLLGFLLGFCVLPGWPCHTRSRCDIDRLLAQFQALFRETPILPIHAAFRRRKSFLWKPRGFFR